MVAGGSSKRTHGLLIRVWRHLTKKKRLRTDEIYAFRDDPEHLILDERG
jgi:hypothetical protein